MLRQSKIDLVFIFVFTCITILCVNQLFFNSQNTLVKEFSIAEVINFNNIVKEKPVNQLNWFDTSSGGKLEAGDLIFTHNDSKAKIKFYHGPIITVEENTLFKVGPDPESSRLQRGRVRAFIKDKSKTFNILLNDEKYALNGENADIIIKNKGKNSTITLVKGKLEIKKENTQTPVTVTENQEVIINDEKISVETIKLELISPSDKSEIKKLSDEKIKLEWLALEQSTVEVSKSENFKDIIFSETTSKKFIEINLLPGQYFWRVQNDEQNSPIYKFTITEFSAPIISNDLKNQKIIFQNSTTLPLAWSSLGINKNYILEISRDGKKEMIRAHKSEYNLTLDGPGLIQWRVREYDESKNYPWSQMAKIDVLKPQKIHST
jgi:hypothetical protein